MKLQGPRSTSFYGMRSDPQFMELGTWLEPEEICYPSGRLGIRRARAYNTNTGKLVIVRTGIPDTFFSLPVSRGGFLSVSDGGVLIFHPPKAQ